MNANFVQARELIAKAREALRRNDSETARQLGEQAALLAPDMEDAWLVLAASEPNPEDALAYAEKAVQLNPQSTRAHKGVEWAEGRLKQAQAGRTTRVEPVAAARLPKAQTEAIARPIKRESKKNNPPVEVKPNRRVWMVGATFGLLACIVFVFTAWSAITSPAFASILNSPPAPTQEILWAHVNIAKPLAKPIVENANAQAADLPASTPVPTLPPLEATPTNIPTLPPADVPSAIPSDLPAEIPAATETPGTITMEIVADTPTSAYVPPAANQQPSYPSQGNGVRWIDVNLSQQMVYAYEGDVIVNSFVVSTGTAQTPTVTGKYKIWIKLKSTTMSGPGYYLTNVPYAMYFYKGYGLHGTYWHNNFGTPMSHGCVNLSIPDAEWLYNFAYEGTVVNVHY